MRILIAKLNELITEHKHIHEIVSGNPPETNEQAVKMTNDRNLILGAPWFQNPMFKGKIAVEI